MIHSYCKMIRIEDLMVGDWVEAVGKPYQYKCATINSEREIDGGLWVTDPKGRSYFTKYSDLEPIEMTIDVLKKNDFTEVLPDAWTIDGFGVMFRVIDGHIWYMFSEVPISITWVHEFQHVLKAARININVIL